MRFLRSVVALVSLMVATQSYSNTPDSISIRVSSDGRLPYDLETWGFAHISFYNAVLGRLLNLNEKMSLSPDILESAFWDYKNERYVLKIRKDLKFHNGRPVKIDDLDFSLIRFFLTAKRADQKVFLNNIVGINKLKPGQTYKPWMVSGIKKTDDRTLTVKLRDPNPAFLYSLCDGWISLVPIEELQDDYVSWKRYPIGVGPYKVENVDKNINQVNLVRIQDNSNLPKNIQFVTSISDNTDVVAYEIDNPKPGKLVKYVDSHPLGFTGLFFNYRSELANIPEFRKAISLAVDRNQFAATNPDLKPLSELLPSNFWGRSEQELKHNVAEAKQLLKNVPSKLLARPIKICSARKSSQIPASRKKLLEVLSKQLSEIGISTQYEICDSFFFDANDTESVMRLDDRGTAFVDPLVIFNAFSSNGLLGGFMPKPDDKELVTLLEQAKSSPSLDVAILALKKLSRFFQDHHYIVPIVEKPTVYWLNPNKVERVKTTRAIALAPNDLVLRK